MQNQPGNTDSSENKNMPDPIDAWGSVNIRNTRKAEADALKKKFSIGLWAWLWCLVCMLLSGLISLAIHHPNPFGPQDAAGAAGYRIGGFIGSGLGVFVMSYIAGWFFWRVTGRNKTVGRTFFCLMAGFALLSQILQFVQYSSMLQRQQSIDEVISAFQEVPRQAEKFQSQFPDAREDIPAYVNKLLGAYDAKAASGDTSDSMRTRRFKEGRKVVEHRLILEVEYYLTLNRLRDYYSQVPRFFANQNNIDKVIGAGDVVMPAGKTYLHDVYGYPAYVKSMLSEEAFPAKAMVQFYQGMDEGAESIRYELESFVDANDSFASTGTKMLEVLSKNKQKWRLGRDEKFEFTDQRALDDFSAAQGNFIYADARRVEAFRRVQEAQQALSYR